MRTKTLSKLSFFSRKNTKNLSQFDIKTGNMFRKMRKLSEYPSVSIKIINGMPKNKTSIFKKINIGNLFEIFVENKSRWFEISSWNCRKFEIIEKMVQFLNNSMKIFSTFFKIVKFFEIIFKFRKLFSEKLSQTVKALENTAKKMYWKNT